jgi:hypothetical protein
LVGFPEEAGSRTGGKESRRIHEGQKVIHTIKVIAGGFALLLLCILVGRLVGGANQPHIVARAALAFIPLWFVGAGINMWFGVTKAGYSVKEELPFFLIVFLIPAAVAFLLYWKYSRSI